MAPARIIVVDDEPDIGSMVTDCLAREGHLVSSCSCGAELDEMLETVTPDLVILDVSMPEEDGISIARRLNANHAVPFIMLTALDDVIDRVVGLEVGADDYITKPFDPRELAARVRAVLRRIRPAATPRPTRSSNGSADGMVCFGKAFLDFEKQCLRDRDGVELPTTAGEYDLLASFARHPNTVLSREKLLRSVTEPAAACDRAIDIRVTRIRKRIEINPTRPQVIRTVRSVGYVYVPPA